MLDNAIKFLAFIRPLHGSRAYVPADSFELINKVAHRLFVGTGVVSPYRTKEINHVARGAVEHLRAARGDRRALRLHERLVAGGLERVCLKAHSAPDAPCVVHSLFDAFAFNTSILAGTSPAAIGSMMRNLSAGTAVGLSSGAPLVLKRLVGGLQLRRELGHSAARCRAALASMVSRIPGICRRMESPNIRVSIFVKVPVPQFTVLSYFPALASKNFI